MGPTGPEGPQGGQGVAGETGPQGEVGPIGMTFKGLWDNTVDYVATDVVAYDAQTWFAVAPSKNVQPDTDPTYWVALAGIGEQGPKGDTGDQGRSDLQGRPDQRVQRDRRGSRDFQV